MSRERLFMKKFRAAVFVFGTSSLLWAPCILLSLAFFFHDAHYRLATSDFGGNSRLTVDYRAAAASLENGEPFSCFTQRHRMIAEGEHYDQRDTVLAAMHRAKVSLLRRAVVLYDTPYLKLIRWVDTFDVPLLRRGREIAARYPEGSGPFSKFNGDKIRPYCEQQDLRRVLNEPPLLPLEISGGVRSMLLRTADRMDEALAAYEEVRPWLLVFFYAWITYSGLGLLCAVYLLRLTRLSGKAMHAAREVEDLPP